MAASKSKESCSTVDLPGLDTLLTVLRAHNVASAAFMQGQICEVKFFTQPADDGGAAPTVETDKKTVLSPGMLRAFDIMKGKIPPREEPEG